MSKSSTIEATSFLSRYAGLRSELPGDPARRDEAAALLREHGLPSRRVESWKYTNLQPMMALSYREPLTEAGGATNNLPASLLPDLAVPRLVFVNGRHQPKLSLPPAHIRPGFFAQNPRLNSSPALRSDQLLALNTMLAEDGLVIEVPEGQDAGSLLLASLTLELPGHHPVACHPRHRITVHKGARLTLIDMAAGHGRYCHNPVMEITVHEGATLTHIRLQDESTAAYHLSTTYADVAAHGVYDSFLLTTGAQLARCEIHARLMGQAAAVHLNGAQLLRGNQHADFTTVIAHDAPHCASRQTVKNVLSGHSRGVFQGKIEVARAAQKTDGYQMNQALLLSPDAEIDSKPQLEIYADDVKCSHGATVGELDADQLFYLRSRGIPDSEARALLVRAFLSEALDPIADETVRALLEPRIDAWWREDAA
jgi:Fe-S cluster assembly protein SufD